MKKIFNYLLIVTLLIGTAVSFGSCKDDDEDEKTGGYSIVGTWKYSSSSGTLYDIVVFNADGTYSWTEVDTQYQYSDTDSGRYTYSNNTITFYYEDGEDPDVETIQWVDKNHFILDGDDYYRQ